MSLLILDNYDSFTYNLYHLLETISEEPIAVFKNDQISLDAVDAYDRIVLSPGPGLPKDAGIMPALLERYARIKPIFGVCLGMQAIGEYFGGTLKNLDTVYHGLGLPVWVKQHEPLFRDCPASFTAGRYHSWVVDPVGLPEALEVIAEDEHKHIMALKHRTWPVAGVQFHPESILSEHGATIFRNWLSTYPSNA